MMPTNRAGILLAMVAILAGSASGQQYDLSSAAGGPFSRVPVLNAPFSAEASTRIEVQLPDHTARQYTVTTRLHRDSQGRVRGEIDTPGGPYILLQMPGTPARERDPSDVLAPGTYFLDPGTRTYRIAGFFMAQQLFNGEGRVAIPVGKVCFQTAPPVVADASDEERLRAVQARMSPDLGIVTASRRADQIAVVDYEVTNIRRREPSASLFEVPSDYTLVRGSHDDILIGFSPWKVPPTCGPVRR